MDNYVTNPHTGRLIKKGSKVHKRLSSYRTDKGCCTAEGTTNKEDYTTTTTDSRRDNQQGD